MGKFGVPHPHKGYHGPHHRQKQEGVSLSHPRKAEHHQPTEHTHHHHSTHHTHHTGHHHSTHHHSTHHHHKKG